MAATPPRPRPPREIRAPGRATPADPAAATRHPALPLQTEAEGAEIQLKDDRNPAPDAALLEHELQREIEQAVPEALTNRSRTGMEKLPAKATLTMRRTSLNLGVDGAIDLE